MSTAHYITSNCQIEEYSKRLAKFWILKLYCIAFEHLYSASHNRAGSDLPWGSRGWTPLLIFLPSYFQPLADTRGSTWPLQSHYP